MFLNNFDEDATTMMNMFIETSSLQYYENNDDIYDDGIKMNDLLLVLRIIYSEQGQPHEGGNSYGSSPPPHIALNSPIPNL